MRVIKKVFSLILTASLIFSSVPAETISRSFLAPPVIDHDKSVMFSEETKMSGLHEEIKAILKEAKGNFGIEHRMSVSLKTNPEKAGKRMARLIGRIVDKRKQYDKFIDELSRYYLLRYAKVGKREEILKKEWQEKCRPFYEQAEKLGIELPKEMISGKTYKSKETRNAAKVKEDLKLLCDRIVLEKNKLLSMDAKVKQICAQLPGDLVNKTDIGWINDILTEEIPEGLKKYLDMSKEDLWKAALLFDAEGKFAKRHNLNLPEELASKSPWKTFKPGENNDIVKKKLQAAAERGEKLTISAHLRAIDGPGSSQDLTRFQVKLTIANYTITYVIEMPGTTFLSAEYKCTLVFEAADYDGIIYDNVQRFIEKNPRVRTAKELSNPDNLIVKEGEEKGFVNYADMPAWVLANYFGITSGVKITGEPLSQLPMQGGMESSNAFAVAVYTGGSMLSEANWNIAKIHKQSTIDENIVFGNITGGQGHGSSVVGGIATLRWTSGMNMDDAERTGDLDDEYWMYRNETYGALVELLDIKNNAVIDNLYLVQPGKDFDENGKPIEPRSSVDTNYEWTEEWDDPIGQRLHFLKVALHQIWIRSLELGDNQGAAYTLNMYSRIRLALNERYKQWLKITTGKNAPAGIRYMDKYSEPLFKEVVEAGGGFMPAGAGGLGAVCILYLPEKLALASKSGKYYGRTAKDFFRMNGLGEFDEAEADAITSVKLPGDPMVRILHGYIKFQENDEPVKISEGWSKIAEPPALPPIVFYNQQTGKVLSAKDFIDQVLTHDLPEQAIKEIKEGLTIPETMAKAKRQLRAIQKVRNEIAEIKAKNIVIKISPARSKEILEVFQESL